MSKRKSDVSNIIYELDNDDIEVSSGDEAKASKIIRLDRDSSLDSTINPSTDEGNRVEIVNVNSTDEDTCENEIPANAQNGGKMSSDKTIIENNLKVTGENIPPSEVEHDNDKKLGVDCSNTTIFNEDIVIDSPVSNTNSDLGVVGCENRTPLVTVRFKDKRLANSYKEKIKLFMLKLIKLHDDKNLVDSAAETDLELEIWPEDLIEEVENTVDATDTIFFEDTAPCLSGPVEIPRYSQVSTLISNVPKNEPPPPPSTPRRGPTCFNCDGAHPLRECKLPRNHSRIAEKRKNMTVRVGRYHVEDDQKYGHLVPGRISGQLRHALGLKRHELPLHIYRMRLLGYPPGWLEEARISHSGITMFDSTGNAILDPEEEEGEVCEPGSKDKFDIKKILDFPGFNVPASSRYKEEGHLFGLPPLSEQDSKMAMLQTLAPNAMKAYKRKKLAFFPSAPTDSPVQAGQAEMELDSGDEVAEFPSVPPLPDDAPPPPPPPPASLPPPPPPPPATLPDLPALPAPPPDQPSTEEQDIEVIEVTKVNDIPVPPIESIIIDDDDKLKNGRTSPSIDDLEERKRILLNALESDDTVGSSDILVLDSTGPDIDVEGSDNEETTNEKQNVSAKTNHSLTGDTSDEIADKKVDNQNEVIAIEDEQIIDIDTADIETSTAINSPQTVDVNTKTDSHITENNENPLDHVKKALEDHVKNALEDDVKVDEIVIDVVTNGDNKETETSIDSSQKIEVSQPSVSSCSSSQQIPNKKGHVKTSLYGTPVINIASPYSKLPSDVEFSKDICDVINFENLPDSVGKYKKISKLLKKVKSEVDRIQES